MSKRRSVYCTKVRRQDTPRMHLNLRTLMNINEPPPPYSSRSCALPALRCAPSSGRFPQLITKSDLKNDKLSKVTFKYHARPGEKAFVEVHQQPAGGSVMTVFKGLLEDGEEFTIVSLRQPFFPFALTFYLNFELQCRISVCCEQRHKIGYRFPGKTGTFSIACVSGGRPCYLCRVFRSKSKEREVDTTDGIFAKGSANDANDFVAPESARSSRKDSSSVESAVRSPSAVAEDDSQYINESRQSPVRDLISPQSNKDGHDSHQNGETAQQQPSRVGSDCCCCFKTVVKAVEKDKEILENTEVSAEVYG